MNSLKLLVGKDVAQIDHTKGDKMSAHEVDMLAVITNDESRELINPGKGAFTGKAMLVDS